MLGLLKHDPEDSTTLPSTAAGVVNLHIAPGRAGAQNPRMPLTVRRLSATAGPRSPRAGSNGLRIGHSASVRSPRLNAAPLREAALESFTHEKNRQYDLA